MRTLKIDVWDYFKISFSGTFVLCVHMINLIQTVASSKESNAITSYSWNTLNDIMSGKVFYLCWFSHKKDKMIGLKIKYIYIQK